MLGGLGWFDALVYEARGIHITIYPESAFVFSICILEKVMSRCIAIQTRVKSKDECAVLGGVYARPNSAVLA